MRFNVWQSVQFVTEGHYRTGQAGTVHGVNADDPNHVAVKWDTGGVTELVPVDDLKAL